MNYSALIRSFFLSLALLFLCAAQKTLGELYQDKNLGFEFCLLTRWKPIPLQPNDKTGVARFDGPEIEIIYGQGKPAKANPSLKVMKFTKKKAEVVTGQDLTDSARVRLKELDDRANPKSFEDWLKIYFPKGLKNSSSKETKYGKLSVKEREYSSDGNITEFRTYAAEFESDEQQIVLVFSVPEVQYSKWADAFRQCAQSFRWIPKIKSNEKTSVTASESNIDVLRRKHQEDVDKIPGWYLEETDRYFIKIHHSDQKFIEDVKMHIELIRDRLEEDFPAVQPILEKSVLRVCKNKDEYTAYGGPAQSAGYWSSSARELVIFDNKERQRSDTFRTLYHEAFHQYIFYRCGNIAPHPWFNEGMGDYYGGAELEYGKLVIRPFLWRRDTIREAVHANRYVPFEKIFHWSQRDYYADSKLAYAEGWSLVYFLREGKKKNIGDWEKSWDNILPTYLEVLTQSKNPEKALEAALASVDISSLEKAWKEFVKKI